MFATFFLAEMWIFFWKETLKIQIYVQVEIAK